MSSSAAAAATSPISDTQDESSQPFRFSLFEFLKLLVLSSFWVTVCTGNVTRTCQAYVDTVRDTKGKILFNRHSKPEIVKVEGGKDGKDGEDGEDVEDGADGENGKCGPLIVARYKPEKTKVQDGEIGLICFCTMTPGYESDIMRSYIFESRPEINGDEITFGKFTTKKTGLSFPVSVTTKQPPGIEIGIPKLFVPALMLCLRDGKEVNVKVHASSFWGMELYYPKARIISVTLNRKGVPETIAIIPVGKPPSEHVVVNLTRCCSVSEWSL
uniref:Uncharacterized protein n=1 Tax=viral metagenome TaxID=1070528 RepID=A0A6C0DZD5_9ZZZZ